ncbi:GFA family protein [Shimia marina]|uniref:CENP-V/GFA domain-containing protein n=1 Tax=Shimia marina TaxID=321267 RepID=A0A0P1FA90_9RHOB|nr:GFA family protein [Shimia marina]CUH51906.1 hypothetical protein SHM7688_01345 [Shimia marina]SFE46067.1 Uncharacterized conserved protein [Shimia marina]
MRLPGGRQAQLRTQSVLHTQSNPNVLFSLKGFPMSKSTFPLTASCLCGQIKITVDSEPILTLACHCQDCQKLTASAFSMTAMLPTEATSIEGQLTSGGLRGTEKTHYFCKSCLSFIYTQMHYAPERVNLRTAMLQELSCNAPFVELMTDEKLPWAQVPAQHSYAQYPETSDEFHWLLSEYANQS